MAKTYPSKIKMMDMYCGGGGTTTGGVDACEELSVLVEVTALNHDPDAIAVHTRNHPKARHLLTGADNVDPRELYPDRKLDLLVASPECTNHSRAKGGKPRDEQSRVSGFKVIDWATQLDIKAIFIENVPEWVDWGPLDEEGKPIKKSKGKTFKAFIVALKSLGYYVEWRIINCADYGDPTSRRRFFLMAIKGKKPKWPEPTHSKEPSRSLLWQTEKWRSAAEVINWRHKGKSIFARGKKPLVPNTLRRIEVGLRKISGIEVDLQALMNMPKDEIPMIKIGQVTAPSPYLVKLYGTSNTAPVDEPLPTVTANGQHLAVAKPFLVSLYGQSNAHEVEKPLPTVTAGARHTALAQPFMIPFYGERKGQEPRTVSIDEPLDTVTCQSRMGVCQPMLIPTNHGKDPRAYSVERPLPTITSCFDAMGIAQPFLIAMEHGGRTRDVDEPLPTITSTDAFAVANPFLVQYHGGKDGDRRVYPVEAPLPTVDTGNRYGVANPFLVKFYNTGGACPVDLPLPTQTTNDRFGLVQPRVVMDEDGNLYLFDILFRMLDPEELAAATFRPGYKLEPAPEYLARYKNKKLSRKAKVKLTGNAVPYQSAKAHLQALLVSAGLADPKNAKKVTQAEPMPVSTSIGVGACAAVPA